MLIIDRPRWFKTTKDDQEKFPVSTIYYQNHDDSGKGDDRHDYGDDGDEDDDNGDDGDMDNDVDDHDEPLSMLGRHQWCKLGSLDRLCNWQ